MRSDWKAIAALDRRIPGRMTLWLHMLCACAMLLVASVHQPPTIRLAASQGSDLFDLSDYALPDGSLPVICLTDSGESGDPAKVKHRSGCEACRLTAAPALLAPSNAVYRSADYRRRVEPIPEDNVRLGVAPRSPAAPRAPPFADIDA